MLKLKLDQRNFLIKDFVFSASGKKPVLLQIKLTVVVDLEI